MTSTDMDTLTWIVPPACQGQIIEVAYATDGEFLYVRATNRSDGRVTVARVAWDWLGADAPPYAPWTATPAIDDARHPVVRA